MGIQTNQKGQINTQNAKHKPRLNTQKHTRPNQAVYELVLVAVRMENFQCTA